MEVIPAADNGGASATEELERRDREGYSSHPPGQDLLEWEAEAAWPA
jgi:hypothetical protein